MANINCAYISDGQSKITHLGNNAQIVTDLPLDNGGKGRSFSPTDLFAASLAACALTIMGKTAAARGKNFEGVSIDVEKVMASAPRRVAELILTVIFPPAMPVQERQLYLASINTCPVHNSLSKDIIVKVISA